MPGSRRRASRGSRRRSTWSPRPARRTSAGRSTPPSASSPARGGRKRKWKWGQEILARAADHAKANNVTLVVEYLNRFECYFLNCAEDCARFTREVGHPNLKMMYDTFHANIEEKSIGAAVKACADQMVHVHISENDRSTPGEGGINWDASFQALKDVKYDGWLMIEAFGLALPDLAAATRIWRRMFPSEEHLATKGLAFMKARSK